MKNNKSLIRHYNFLGFEFDNYDIYIFLTILIGFIFFSLLLPLKVFATYDSNKYFNLIYPTNISNDVSSSSTIKFGSDATLYDVLNDLENVDTSSRKLLYGVVYTSGNLKTLYISALETGSMPYVQVYGTDNTTSLAFKHYIMNDLGTLTYSFTSCSNTGSILDSEAYKAIKQCLSTGTCTSTLPTEPTYTCSVSSSVSKTISNTSFNVSNYDNSSVNFDITTRTVPLYSDLTLIFKEKSGYLNRKLHIDNTLDIAVDDIYPSYYDFINVPEPDDPDNPDNPDIDTDVGVWKNYVLWFVDNNSVYGVLVNIYILFFISIIGTSFIVFVKMIRKNRW